MGVILRKAIVLFGLIHLSLIIIALWLFVVSPTGFHFAFILFATYLFPVMVFRLQNRWVPLEEGTTHFSDARYCPWWGAHQMQQVYSAVPFLEGILRIIPGVYSAWLRLWGSKIGKQVYWTPRIEIVDRSLLVIGDYVIFGHRAACSSHIIKQQDGNLILKVGKVRLGKSVLVGAGARLGPGTIVVDKITIPINTILLIDQHVDCQAALKKVHHDPIVREVKPKTV